MFARFFLSCPVSAGPWWLPAKPSDSPLPHRSGFLGTWGVRGGLRQPVECLDRWLFPTPSSLPPTPAAVPYHVTVCSTPQLMVSHRRKRELRNKTKPLENTCLPFSAPPSVPRPASLGGPNCHPELSLSPAFISPSPPLLPAGWGGG